MEVPLEELQEIGDRYSPRVLRSFLRSNGFVRRSDFFHIGDDASLDISVRPLEPAKANLVSRLIMLTATPMILCAVFGSLAFFSHESTWDNVDDLTQQYAVVMAAAPGLVATILFTYGLVSSVAGEVIACIAVREKKISVFHTVFALIGGIFSRLSILLDCAALVIVVKGSPSLALVGSPAWIGGLGLGLVFVPIRTFISLLRKDFFEITSFSITGSKAAVAVSLAAPASPRHQHYRLSESLNGAVSTPENHLQIRRICHAAIVFDWNCLASILVKDFASIPLQTDLLLMSSVKAYFLSLSHQLLLLPVKVFFIYDVAPNVLVVASVAVTVVAVVLACVRNAVPLHSTSTVDDILDSPT